MENFKCPLCNRKSTEPINLRCEHHPCFQCASQIIAIDHESPLETKYRIVCPICYKKTITLDLRHLIINATEQDEDMYVTTKFISKKPEVSHVKKNNYTEGKSHPKPNVASNRTVAIECKKHAGHNLQYLCEDCWDRNESDVYLCVECAKGHKHRLTSILNASDKIQALSNKRKESMFSSKYDSLTASLQALQLRKDSLASEYQVLYRDVAEEFKALYHQINEQYESVKKDLKMMYSKQYEEIKASISLGEKFRESIEELEKISSQNCTQIESQVHFSMCMIQIERAMENNRAKLGQKFELPKIVKRAQIALGSAEKIVDVQFVNRLKESSRPVTPTNSARFFNYSLDASKSRPETKAPDLTLFKQNFNPIVSPRNYFSNKPNI